MHKNESEYFPKLRLRQLIHYAKLWKDDCPDIPIVRITLCKYHSRYTKAIKKDDPQPQSPLYIVVFEVSGIVLDPYTSFVSWDDANQEEEESICKKIKDRFNLPDDIPNQGVLEYIGDSYDRKKSFGRKVRDSFKEVFNIPDNIANRGVLRYIKNCHGVKIKAPLFLKAKDMEFLEETCELLEPFKNKRNFINEMNNRSTSRLHKSIFIDGYDGFDDVYKAQPRGGKFNKEWLFIAVPPEGPLPKYVYVDDSWFWVLWDKNKPIEEKTGKSDVNAIKKDDDVYDTQIEAEVTSSDEERVIDIPQKVIDSVTRVMPQVILVYNSLKKGPGWKMGNQSMGLEARMEDALNFYDENQSVLSNLNRDALTDPDIYERNYSNDKRDMVERIIKKDVELKGLGKYSARRLCKIKKPDN